MRNNTVDVFLGLSVMVLLIITVLLSFQNMELKNRMKMIKIYDKEYDSVRTAYVDEDGIGVIIIKYLGKNEYIHIRFTLDHKESKRIIEMYNEYKGFKKPNPLDQ